MTTRRHTHAGTTRAPGPASARQAGRSAWPDLARRQGEEISQRGLQHAGPFAGTGGVQSLLTAAPPARVLCEHSGTATLVVVGSRGHGRLTGLLLGSVAWQLAGHGQGRIVIVRGPARRPNDAPGPVVAGVDGSAASTRRPAWAAHARLKKNSPAC